MDFKEKYTFSFQNSVTWKMYLKVNKYYLFIPATDIYQMSLSSNLLTRNLYIIIITTIVIIMSSTTRRILACTYVALISARHSSKQ